MRAGLTRDELDSIVLAAIAEVLGMDTAELSLDASLVHDLECDSMDVATIAGEIEEATGLDLRLAIHAGGDAVASVRDLCNLVRGQQLRRGDELDANRG